MKWHGLWNDKTINAQGKNSGVTFHRCMIDIPAVRRTLESTKTWTEYVTRWNFYFLLSAGLKKEKTSFHLFPFLRELLLPFCDHKVRDYNHACEYRQLHVSLYIKLFLRSDQLAFKTNVSCGGYFFDHHVKRVLKKFVSHPHTITLILSCFFIRSFLLSWLWINMLWTFWWYSVIMS